MATKKTAVPVVPEAPKFRYTITAHKSQADNFYADIEVNATSDTEAVKLAQEMLDNGSDIEWFEESPDDVLAWLSEVKRHIEVE